MQLGMVGLGRMGASMTSRLLLGNHAVVVYDQDPVTTAVSAAEGATGVASLAALVSAMEGDIRRRKGRLIRIETSAMEAYGPTRGFYAAMQYREESRFRDFYKVGEDLIILAKRL